MAISSMLGSAVVEMADPNVTGTRSIASMLGSEAVEILPCSTSTSDTEEMDTTQQQRQQREGINTLLIYYQHNTESTWLCVHAASSVKRKTERPSPSREELAVASELIMIQCKCPTNCSFVLRREVEDIVERVKDARTVLHHAGRTKTSALIFDKLLMHRQNPTNYGGKYVVQFIFAGIRVCGDCWCALHGLSRQDSRIKQVLSRLRKGDVKWVSKSIGNKTRKGWRGLWCKSWFRRHVKKLADFDPVKMVAKLDPDPLQARHMLYCNKWSQRATGSQSGSHLSFSRFSELWKLFCEDGYIEEGCTYKIQRRSPRSGFTCSLCQELMEAKCKAVGASEKEAISFQLQQHLQQAREARESYADNILKAELNDCVASIAIDAADQANHHCPSNAFTSRSTSQIKKIIQQFIGVLDHNKGYAIYRRLPYVQKGANLTLTILIDMIRRKHLYGKSEVYIQWDGASENVAKTNLRFFIWLLLYAEHHNLPLLTITVCRLLVGHTHFDVDQRHSVLSRSILGRLGPADQGRKELHSLSAYKRLVEKTHKDLVFFSECTSNYDFDEWLAGMESKLEPGLSTHLQYQLRRANGGVIMARSKPRMSAHVSYSPWFQIWPPEESAWSSRGRQPSAPSFDSSPSACPAQNWKNYKEVRRSLRRFYSEDWWGISAQDRYEMKSLLQKWGDDPSTSCPLPEEWPDIKRCMPQLARPLTQPVDPPRRPPPLITAPYQPLARPRQRRGGGGCRAARGRRGLNARGRRGRGRCARGRRGRGRVARGSRGRDSRGRRGRCARGRHGRVMRVRRGGVTIKRGCGVINSNSSSEEEFCLSKPRCRRRIVSDSSSTSTSSSSSEDVLLCDLISDKYPIGTRVRKKFGRQCFDGSIVSRNIVDKHWHVKYTDGDSESMSEDELRTHIEQYNTKYNKHK